MYCCFKNKYVVSRIIHVYKFCDYFTSMITAQRKLHANILLKSSTKTYDHQDLEHCVTVLLYFFFLSSILVYLVLLPLKLSTMHILQFGCHTSCSRFEDHFSINHIYRVQSQTCHCM